MLLLALAAILATFMSAWLVFQQPITLTSAVRVAVVRSFEASSGCSLAACAARSLCCSSLLRVVPMWTSWDVHKVRFVLQLCVGAVLTLRGSYRVLRPCCCCRRLFRTLLPITNTQSLCLQACACLSCSSVAAVFEMVAPVARDQMTSPMQLLCWSWQAGRHRVEPKQLWCMGESGAGWRKPGIPAAL